MRRFVIGIQTVVLICRIFATLSNAAPLFSPTRGKLAEANNPFFAKQRLPLPPALPVPSSNPVKPLIPTDPDAPPRWATPEAVKTDVFAAAQERSEKTHTAFREQFTLNNNSSSKKSRTITKIIDEPSVRAALQVSKKVGIYNDVFRGAKSFFESKYFKSTLPGFSSYSFTSSPTLPASFADFYSENSDFFDDHLAHSKWDTPTLENLPNDSSAEYAAILHQRIEEARLSLSEVESAGNKPKVLLSNTPVFLDDSVCERYIFSGNLRVAGNLRVRGKLDIVSGFNAETTIDPKASAHIKNRCVVKDESMYYIDGDLNLPYANMLIVGNVVVGGSVIVGKVNVDAGSSLIIGMRGMVRSIELFARENGVLKPARYSAFEKGLAGQDSERISINLWSTSAGSSPTMLPKRNDSKPKLFNVTMKDVWNLAGTSPSLKNADTIVDNRCLVLDPLGVPLREEKEKKESSSTPSSAVGDLVTVSLSLHNAAAVIVYGNIRAELGVIIDGASEAHSLCGQMYTDSSQGVGLVVVDGSVAAISGFAKSQVFQVTLQDAAIFSINNSLFVRGAIQADESSMLLGGGSVSAAAVAVDDQSRIIFEGDVDVGEFIECIDNGKLFIGGNAFCKAMQIYDGGAIHVLGGVFVSSFVTLDNSAELHIEGVLDAVTVKQKYPKWQPNDRLISSPKSARPGRVLQGEWAPPASNEPKSGSTGKFEKAAATPQLGTGGQSGNGDPSGGRQVPNQDEDNSSENSAGIEKDFEPKSLGLVSSKFALFSADNIHVSQSSKVFASKGDICSTKNLKVVTSNIRVLGGSIFLLHNLIVGKSSTLTVGEHISARGYVRADSAPRRLEKSLPLKERINWASPPRVLLAISDPPGFGTIKSSPPNAFKIPAQEEEGRSNLPSSTLEAQPALYCEGSEVTVGGSIHTFHTWFEASRGCSVNAGVSVQSWAGMMIVDGGSTIGTPRLKVDKGLVLERNSEIDIQTQNLKQVPYNLIANINITTLPKVTRNQVIEIDAQFLRLASASKINISNGRLLIAGNSIIEGRSKIQVDGAAIFRGKLLYVDEASTLTAHAIGTTSGDIFVEDGSRVVSTRSDVVGGHAIIAQDRGCVISARKVVARTGDIIAENFGCVEAATELSAWEGSIRRTPESTLLYQSSRNEGVQMFLQDAPEVYMWDAEKGPSSVVVTPSSPAVATDPVERFVSKQSWSQ